MTLMMMKRISYPYFDQKSGAREGSQREGGLLAQSVGWDWIQATQRGQESE